MHNIYYIPIFLSKIQDEQQINNTEIATNNFQEIWKIPSRRQHFSLQSALLLDLFGRQQFTISLDLLKASRCNQALSIQRESLTLQRKAPLKLTSTQTNTQTYRCMQWLFEINSKTAKIVMIAIDAHFISPTQAEIEKFHSGHKQFRQRKQNLELCPQRFFLRCTSRLADKASLPVPVPVNWRQPHYYLIC